jgi:hypothetical protein
MPKVGKKKFPYTEKGMKKAKAHAKKKGLPMSDARKRSKSSY